MEKEKYLKLIYEKGSIIFRRVSGYTICDKTQLMIVTFEDKSASAVDMMFLNACLGKMTDIKDNVCEHKEITKLDISQDL